MIQDFQIAVNVVFQTLGLIALSLSDRCHSDRGLSVLRATRTLTSSPLQVQLEYKYLYNYVMVVLQLYSTYLAMDRPLFARTLGLEKS